MPYESLACPWPEPACLPHIVRATEKGWFMRKKKFVALFICVCAVICVLLLGGIYMNSFNPSSGVKIDTAAEAVTSDAADETPMINFPVYGDVTIQTDDTSIPIQLLNPEGNLLHVRCLARRIRCHLLHHRPGGARPCNQCSAARAHPCCWGLHDGYRYRHGLAHRLVPDERRDRQGRIACRGAGNLTVRAPDLLQRDSI